MPLRSLLLLPFLTACSFSGSTISAGDSRPDGATSETTGAETGEGATTSGDDSSGSDTDASEATTAEPTTDAPTTDASEATTDAPTTDEPTTATTEVTSDSETGCMPEIWYPDADMDGFGDPDSPVASCDPVEGHVTKGGDCVDDNPKVNPQQAELCDGLDNNCNKLVDEFSPMNMQCQDCALRQFAGSFYAFCPQHVRWTPAGEGCQARGGTLVIIEEMAENDFVFTTTVGIEDTRWWIGATDSEDEGTWLWVNGAAVADGFQKWAKDEPDNGGVLEDNNCMAIGALGEWWDEECSDNRPFVCEMKP